MALIKILLQKKQLMMKDRRLKEKKLYNLKNYLKDFDEIVYNII